MVGHLSHFHRPLRQPVISDFSVFDKLLGTLDGCKFFETAVVVERIFHALLIGHVELGLAQDAVYVTAGDHKHAVVVAKYPISRFYDHAPQDTGTFISSRVVLMLRGAGAMARPLAKVGRFMVPMVLKSLT